MNGHCDHRTEDPYGPYIKYPDSYCANPPTHALVLKGRRLGSNYNSYCKKCAEWLVANAIDGDKLKVVELPEGAGR